MSTWRAGQNRGKAVKIMEKIVIIVATSPTSQGSQKVTSPQLSRHVRVKTVVMARTRNSGRPPAV